MFEQSGDWAKRQIVEAAQRMLSGSLGLIEGSRKIAGLRHSIAQHSDEVFFRFVALDSDTDHIPMDAPGFGKAYLARVGEEIAPHLDEVRPETRAACKNSFGGSLLNSSDRARSPFSFDRR